jgi:transcriptional regulator with XRE-family HTH domain
MDTKELCAWRERVGLTQEQVAEKLGITRTTVQNWESGATRIPVAVDSACENWEHRLKQENPAFGPVTLVYSDAPMWIDPYGPRRKPAMIQQEAYRNNSAALGRVQELWGREDFQNPFILEQSTNTATGRTLWNVVELGRVVSGQDRHAPTPVQWRSSAIEAVADYMMEHSHLSVRNGPRSLTQAEAKEHKNKVEYVAKKLKKLAAEVLTESAVTYRNFEKLLAELHDLSTYPPNSLVSNVAQAFVTTGG